MEVDRNHAKTVSNVKAYFESLNEKLHVVICLDQRLFDWIPSNNKIRPYNTTSWYLMPQNIPDIVEYLRNIHHKMLEATDDGYAAEEQDIRVGTIIENILLIDLNKTIDHLATIVGIFELDEQYTSDEIEEFHKETDILIDQASWLRDYLKVFYGY